MNTDNLGNTKLKKWEAPIVVELQMDDTKSGGLTGSPEAFHSDSTNSGTAS
jgi:hypothetical protein